jgi:proteasome accessory factor C
VTAILFGLDILRESLESERPDLLADIAGIKEKIGKSLDRSITGEPGVSGSVSAAINLALKNREKLNITYHSLARDELSKRVVHPIERRLEDGFEILLAFCEEADALRTFRLDRITHAIRVESPSQPASIVNSIDRIRVKIRVHSDHREVFEALGDLQPNPDGTFVVDVYNQSWLIREVLASAGSIEVIEPIELRQEIARQGAGIAAQYR